MQKPISPQARKEANKIIREIFNGWIIMHLILVCKKLEQLKIVMDADIHMIQNEKIDEISKVINEDFERLLELQTTNEESVVF